MQSYPAGQCRQFCVDVAQQLRQQGAAFQIWLITTENPCDTLTHGWAYHVVVQQADSIHDLYAPTRQVRATLDAYLQDRFSRDDIKLIKATVSTLDDLITDTLIDRDVAMSSVASRSNANMYRRM
jgi:hypothetical protein